MSYSQQPVISVVIPVLNRAHFLPATLRSVFEQSFPNIECIVIDGGSTDGTLEVIHQHEALLAYWESTPDKGQAEAINKGFSHATGEIFAWLNADDIWQPEAISNLLQTIRQYQDANIWVGGCHRVTTKGRRLNTVWPKSLTPLSLANWGRNFFYQPACFFTAHAWNRAGGLQEQYHYAFDVDLWLRLIQWAKFVPIPHILAAATIHASAKTQANRQAMHKEIVEILEDHHYFAEAGQYQRRLRWQWLYTWLGKVFR